MDSIEEKRVYGDREGATHAYVAGSIGVVRVRAAGDAIGEFGLCDRCVARDITAAAGTIAVATDEDVRLLDTTDATPDDEPTFVDAGFGPAVAVGGDDSRLIAAGSDGRVAQQAADGNWTALASDFDAAVRAIDGDLLATDRGVYRVYGGGLDHAGLSNVADVSAPGVPLAATDEGLYKLGNGWMSVFEEPVGVVDADPQSAPGSIARAYACSNGTVFELDPATDEWRAADGPAGDVVGFGYDDGVYAVTASGSFAATTGDGWRSQVLGVDGITGLAVSPGRSRE
jgi:hypothetical protein